MLGGVAKGLAAAVRQAWACLWWSVRAHVADRHGLPRGAALEPRPALWRKDRAGVVHVFPAAADPRPRALD